MAVKFFSEHHTSIIIYYLVNILIFFHTYATYSIKHSYVGNGFQNYFSFYWFRRFDIYHYLVIILNHHFMYTFTYQDAQCKIESCYLYFYYYYYYCKNIIWIMQTQQCYLILKLKIFTTICFCICLFCFFHCNLFTTVPVTYTFNYIKIKQTL